MCVLPRWVAEGLTPGSCGHRGMSDITQVMLVTKVLSKVAGVKKWSSVEVLSEL